MLLVVFAGRVAQAEAEVRRAASTSARAACLRQNAADAEEAARDSAAANLAASGVTCATLETLVDTSGFAPGGTVVVTLRCTASMADVTLLGVPGRRVFEARSLEVIDRHRGGEQ